MDGMGISTSKMSPQKVNGPLKRIVTQLPEFLILSVNQWLLNIMAFSEKVCNEWSLDPYKITPAYPLWCNATIPPGTSHMRSKESLNAPLRRNMPKIYAPFSLVGWNDVNFSRENDRAWKLRKRNSLRQFHGDLGNLPPQKKKRTGIKGAAGFSSGYFLWKCGNVQQNMYIIYTWVLDNLLDFWLLLKSKIIIFYTWKFLCSHHVSSKKTKIGWRISAATSKVFCHKIILQLLPIH